MYRNASPDRSLLMYRRALIPSTTRKTLPGTVENKLSFSSDINGYTLTKETVEGFVHLSLEFRNIPLWGGACYSTWGLRRILQKQICRTFIRHTSHYWRLKILPNSFGALTNKSSGDGGEVNITQTTAIPIH